MVYIVLNLSINRASILMSLKSFACQKSLVMRIRIAYKKDDKDALEEGQISNFPRGL